jgi:hypothetical protein
MRFVKIFSLLYFLLLQPKGNGHFAKRHLWLNELPPFTGPDCITRPCLYLRTSASSSPPKPSMLKETCPCCCCNEDLLKLQVILRVLYFVPTATCCGFPRWGEGLWLDSFSRLSKSLLGQLIHSALDLSRQYHWSLSPTATQCSGVDLIVAITCFAFYKLR